MKKIVFAFLLMTAMVQGQSFRYDKLFLEAGIGLGIPLSKLSPSGARNESISKRHFQGALRYMLNENIGLLGSLNYDYFINNLNERNEQKLVGLELVYNIGKTLELYGDSDNFTMLLHGGLNAGAMSSKYNDRDYIGAVVFGIKPVWAFNDKVSFFADATYKSIMEQDVYYNGKNTTYPNPGKFSSSQFALTFGIIASLGNNRTNADFFHIR
ncbi:hypothetical protein [Flavobacterium sp. HJJ]|uniref:hypothetical protein n=1 Tax=Flavobacterium sp. HJJ TaxID=2783792 RepID=UPI001889E9BD|nr:hypothetical protein [Flavobacterium sp. HJJ]MBF4470976.1 hypothetical protein [Flavobacterium sp. HJJ]